MAKYTMNTPNKLTILRIVMIPFFVFFFEMASWQYSYLLALLVFAAASFTARLCREFGATKVIWIDHGALEGDDTDSHIDTLARLAPEDTIIYVSCNDSSDSHYESLKAMERQILGLRRADGNAYNCVGLPLPDPIYDEDGERLPATYANFLILNDAVLMPVYGQKRNDDLALQIMKIVFPDHEIIGIDCNALIRQHGSLHCVTMQFPKGSIA